jgi:hypothetical protein
MFEQDNISAMNRLVKSTMASLEMDDYATLVASPFGPFLSGYVAFAGDKGYFVGRPLDGRLDVVYIGPNSI